MPNFAVVRDFFRFGLRKNTKSFCTSSCSSCGSLASAGRCTESQVASYSGAHWVGGSGPWGSLCSCPSSFHSVPQALSYQMDRWFPRLLSELWYNKYVHCCDKTWRFLRSISPACCSALPWKHTCPKHRQEEGNRLKRCHRVHVFHSQGPPGLTLTPAHELSALVPKSLAA